MINWKPSLAAITLLAAFSAPVISATTESVGTVTKARGKVEAIRDSGAAALKDKDPVFAKDRVRTGPRGLLVARLNDGTKMVLGNNASMLIEEAKYEKDGKENKKTLDVSKGLFRFVSGLSAKNNPDAMKVKLGKLATIGVRGTHFGGKMEGKQATVILLKPEDGSDKKTAITVSGDFGSVTIDVPGQGVVIKAGEPLPAPKPIDITALNCPLFQ